MGMGAVAFVQGGGGAGVGVARLGLGGRARVIVVACARCAGVARPYGRAPLRRRGRAAGAGGALCLTPRSRARSPRVCVTGAPRDHRYLAALLVASLELGQVFRDGDDLASEARCPGGRASQSQSRRILDGAVAIDAIDLDRGARLVVEIAVAVNVRADVTIGA